MMTFDCVVQVILVVNQIYWCQEVEAAFKKLSSNKNAMADYNKLQVQQLTDLIQVTRTELKKEDRQKVMNMITIDAHSRDMIEQVQRHLLSCTFLVSLVVDFVLVGLHPFPGCLNS